MIKHVVTMGLGFSDGVVFIPPLGLLQSIPPIGPIPTMSWPATLPGTDWPGYAETEPAGAIRSFIERGFPVLRPRAVASPRPFNCAMVLTRTQVQTLDDFYTVAIGEGSASFLWEHPRTKAVARIRFVTPPQYRAQAYDAWQMTCQMEVLP